MGKKVSALVTIGYHYGELPWGRIVRAKYLSKNLMESRNIMFYEVKNSDVKTGDISLIASSEIEQIIKKENNQLWINIHCGFHKEKSKLSVLYFGYDENIIEKAQKIKNISVHQWGFMNKDERKAYDFSIPYTIIDAIFFSRAQNKDTFEEMMEDVLMNDYKNLLKKTLYSINSIYDLH